MIKDNNIISTLHNIRKGNKPKNFNYTLRGKKKILFFVLQLIAVVFGWGLMAYIFYYLIFK